MVGGGWLEKLYDIIRPPSSYEAWKQRAQIPRHLQTFELYHKDTEEVRQSEQENPMKQVALMLFSVWFLIVASTSFSYQEANSYLELGARDRKSVV